VSFDSFGENTAVHARKCVTDEVKTIRMWRDTAICSNVCPRRRCFGGRCVSSACGLSVPVAGSTRGNASLLRAAAKSCRELPTITVVG
jgi:hypothetical protein